jgi:very-short-patch-repair endonuclease
MVNNKVCSPKGPKLCFNYDCKVCEPRRIDKELIRKYWINYKNIGINPITDITNKATRKFWFTCKSCNLPLYMQISKFLLSIGCEHCAGSILSVTKQCTPSQHKLCTNYDCEVCNIRRMDESLISTNWLHDRNPGVNTVTDINNRSMNRFWVICPTCEHEVEMPMKKFNNKEACAYCCKGGILCLEPQCSFCNKRRNPLIVKHWIYELNPVDISPYTITTSSQREFYYTCRSCTHPMKMLTANFTGRRGNCDYCTNSEFLCPDTSCTICDRRRSPHLIKNWSYELNPVDISPYIIPKNSNKSFHITCVDCNHSNYIDVQQYTTVKGRCSFCSKKGRGMCDDYTCDICINKRFSSHPMAIHWDNNNNKDKDGNDIDPRDIAKRSNVHYNFICPHCKKNYNTRLDDIGAGYWCGCRKNKTERLVLDWCKETYSQYKIEDQFSLSSCPSRKFDIVFTDLMLIIEVDGGQHFHRVECWSPLDKVQEADSYKMKCAREEGYSMIRISQEDIWNNRLDWKTILSSHIHRYDTPEFILISTNNEYDSYHKQSIEDITNMISTSYSNNIDNIPI